MRKWLSQEEKQNIGTVCYNCGATEDIEYHHIVPLLLGGNDVKSNIVPLCYKCHKAAHMGQHINHYRNNSRGGRHSKSSIEKNAHVFDQYINGEIGCRKAQQLLGYSNRTTIVGLPVFKRYIQSIGIKSVRNIVDVTATNSVDGLSDGSYVGEIIYLDGRKENIYYKDTGANDIEYVKRQCS